MLDEFKKSIEDGTVWDDAPVWANYIVENLVVIGFIEDVKEGQTQIIKLFYKKSQAWAETRVTSVGHGWTEEHIIATRPEKDMLKVLMTELEVDSEAELWEEAPEWANYVVQTDHPSVGFASNLGEAELLLMFNQVEGWTGVMEGDMSVWFEEDVLSVRPRDIFSRDEDGNIVFADEAGVVRIRIGDVEAGDEDDLTEEIVATMDVLNDPGNCGLIIDEFRFHLCELLEMKRKKLT